MNLSDTFLRFARSEQLGGLLLIVCTVASLVAVNTALETHYLGFWQMPLGPLSIEHWINDALMAVFFFLMGYVWLRV